MVRWTQDYDVVYTDYDVAYTDNARYGIMAACFPLAAAAVGSGGGLCGEGLCGTSRLSVLFLSVLISRGLFSSQLVGNFGSDHRAWKFNVLAASLGIT